MHGVGMQGVGMLPLGAVSGGGVAAPGVTYLLRDLFTTDLAAGAINGTTSEPVATWTRAVTDAGNRLTIASGKLVFATGNSVYIDPRLSYTNAFTRTAGHMFFARGLRYASGIVRVGLHTVQPPTATNPAHRFVMSGTTVAAGDSTGYSGAITVVANTAYDYCIIVRATGALYFIKGGIYTDWRLGNAAASATNTPYYVGISNNTGVDVQVDGLELYAMDAYSDSLFAISNDTTPVDGDLMLGAADGFVEFTWTPASAETFELDVRRLDDNNRFIVRCDQAGSTIRIVTVDAGITTLGTTAAQTWTVGTPYRIMVKLSGLNINTDVGGTAKNTGNTAINQTYRGVKVRGFATGSNLFTWGQAGYGSGDAPAAVSAPSLTIASPVPYQVIQRNGSSQADIPIAAVLPINSAILVEARWQGGSWTSLGTFTGGRCEGVLSAQAAGQGLLEVRCNGQTASVAYVGIGDVFMASGQSNASGRGTNNQTYSHATLKAALLGNDYVWKELADPTDSDTNSVDSAGEDLTAAGSVWPLVATEIMATTGFPVAIVPANWGGTSITQWQPGADHYLRSTLYGHLAYRAKKTGARLMLWWQGETDATNAMSQATYNSNFDTMCNAIQSDLGIKTMACKLQNSSGASDVNEAAINAAIAEAWGDNANALTGPDLTDLASDDSYHLQTNAKLLDAAQRWGVKILAVL